MAGGGAKATIGPRQSQVRFGLILLKESKLGNLLKFFIMLFPNRRFYEIEFRLKALFENRFYKY